MTVCCVDAVGAGVTSTGVSTSQPWIPRVCEKVVAAFATVVPLATWTVVSWGTTGGGGWVVGVVDGGAAAV